MNLQKLLTASSRLLETKNYNHSLIQAICHELLFQDNRDSTEDSFRQFLQSQQFSPSLCDMLNVLLFNVCAQNQEMIKRYDQQLLQSTEDAQWGQKIFKITASSINIGKKVRSSLKNWLQTVLNCQFFAGIFRQIKSKSLVNSKCLRSLLETIDYITYKYKLTLSYRDHITESLLQIGKRVQKSSINEKIVFVNKAIFAGGNGLVQLMNQISDNYLINLAEIADIIVINYSNNNSSSRKTFESANNFGETITEEIIDYLIRKCNKNDLFSEKMDRYRPFELLMQIIFQKFGSVLLDYHEAIFAHVKTASGLYSSQSYKAIQYFASLFSYLIPLEYPALHHLFKYTFTSLMAKYSTAESLELIKKFILNRLFLNPFFYALLYTPDPKEMEKFVKIANEMRILFYQKKIEVIATEHKNGKLIEFGQMLRNSLSNMLNDKQQPKKSDNKKDNGIYINDALLNNIVVQVYENLRQKNASKISVSDAPSDSSLSFSLRNDSASRMHPHFPSNIPTIAHYDNSSIPILPKPSSRINRQEKSQKNLKDISTDTFLPDKRQISTISQLEDLVQLRRQYGQIRRTIEARTAEKKSKRQKLFRELSLLQQPFQRSKNKIRNSSSQVHINTVFL